MFQSRFLFYFFLFQERRGTLPRTATRKESAWGFTISPISPPAPGGRQSSTLSLRRLGLFGFVFANCVFITLGHLGSPLQSVSDALRSRLVQLCPIRRLALTNGAKGLRTFQQLIPARNSDSIFLKNFGGRK